ncbi:MAG: phosphohydrolase [Leptolyngbyaceae bacterium]|nr:phosphohydrolase [Leptolyngbyaceae bacterium]
MTDSPAHLLGRAIAIAATAHQHQLDKAHSPYILHPLRLMLRGRTVTEQIVAVLHDVVEDSDWTLEQLAAEGFSAEVLGAIASLTHHPEESYEQFIDRVLLNPLATQVKLYDLEDNMTLTRLSSLSEKDLARLQRYHKAHQRILLTLQEQQSA